ncbi:hypothetical protein Tco_1358170 [Tanacetum coccineum]
MLSSESKKELNLGVGDDRITFLIDKAMQNSHSNDDTCFRMDIIDKVTKEELDVLLDDSKPFLGTSEKISESSLDHELEEFMAIKIKEIPEQEEEVEDNSKNYPLEENLRIKNSIQDPPTNLVMKHLPKQLEYAFLEKDSLYPIVISALLKDDEKKRLVSVLKKHKEAFAWKTSDISGISPSFFKHKINFKDDAKPVIQRQHQLNPNMKEVMKKEIIKLLDVGIIYPIEDSPWVSLVQCIPKKGGMTIMTNEKNELVPIRTVTGWRVCIDYRKLNEATRKDHFPLPFMDQMLERLAGNKFFCFLDGFSGYFQIPIEPSDQEKTMFTCLYGTYALVSDIQKKDKNKAKTDKTEHKNEKSVKNQEEGKMEAISFMAPFPADYRETMPWVAEKPFIYSVVENTCNEATLYDLDETGEGMVKGNFLYVKKDPSKKSPLGQK